MNTPEAPAPTPGSRGLPNENDPNSGGDAPDQSTPAGDTEALEEFAENEGGASTDVDELRKTAQDVIGATSTDS
jgi:hypothetical protein